MATIVPIEDIAEILFDNSENIPNNIYIEFMNMLKQYHQYGNNFEQIHEYIQNFELPLQVKLKKYLLKKYNILDNLNCFCFCTNRTSCYIKIVMLIIASCGLFGIIFYFKIIEKPKALPPPAI